MNTNTFWLVIGFSAQALFSARFLIQWIASEKAGKSVVPELFWYFSLGGAALLLAYAIYRKDPVFILGQSTGFLIYGRNLYFIYKEKRKTAAGA
ncbi:MAG: lipid-A-disaccharide synthase N-terminal domain-containing protein [Desulfobacterales bacterium]